MSSRTPEDTTPPDDRRQGESIYLDNNNNNRRRPRFLRIHARALRDDAVGPAAANAGGLADHVPFHFPSIVPLSVPRSARKLRPTFTRERPSHRPSTAHALPRSPLTDAGNAPILNPRPSTAGNRRGTRHFPGPVYPHGSLPHQSSQHRNAMEARIASICNTFEALGTPTLDGRRGSGDGVTGVAAAAIRPYTALSRSNAGAAGFGGVAREVDGGVGSTVGSRGSRVASGNRRQMSTAAGSKPPALPVRQPDRVHSARDRRGSVDSTSLRLPVASVDVASERSASSYRQPRGGRPLTASHNYGQAPNNYTVQRATSARVADDVPEEEIKRKPEKQRRPRTAVLGPAGAGAGEQIDRWENRYRVFKCIHLDPMAEARRSLLDAKIRLKNEELAAYQNRYVHTAPDPWPEPTGRRPRQSSVRSGMDDDEGSISSMSSEGCQAPSWLSLRQTRVPSPDANTWVYWNEATDRQVTALDDAWGDNTDDSSDDEQGPPAYAQTQMLDQAEIAEATQRVHAKDATLKVRTDRDVQHAMEGMISGALSKKREEKSRELAAWRAKREEKHGGLGFDEAEEDLMLISGGFQAYHGGLSAERRGPRPMTPPEIGTGGVAHSPSRKRGVASIKPYPVAAARKEAKAKQEARDMAWGRRLTGTILDLRGQTFSTETSPFLARFMVDEQRINAIKHVQLSGSFIDPAFSMDLCRILVHTSGVVSLEMLNCGMKFQALQPLCMLIKWQNTRRSDGAAEAQRQKLIDAKKKQAENDAKKVQGRESVARAPNLMMMAKTMKLKDSRNSEASRAEQAIAEKDFKVLLRAQMMKSFNFSTHGLQELKIGGNRIGDRGMMMLAEVLETDRLIRILDVSRAGFGENGAVALGTAMENMRCLEWLSMEWNLIGSGKGAQAIATGLRDSITLRCLDISDCSLGDKGGSYIVSALAENEKLQELDLGNNRLSRDTAEVLADALKKNKTLKTLMLTNNPLGYEGAVKLINAMMINTVLGSLNLFNCSFIRDDTKGGGVSFDEMKPAGSYALDLSLPGHYIIATKLVELWKEQGNKTWRNVKFNGKKFTLKEELHWPERMPLKGTLRLDFVPNEHTGKINTKPLSEDDFDELWCQILHPGVPRHAVGNGSDLIGASDEWILSYTSVLTKRLYFTSSQVAQMVQTLQWSDNRVKLMVMMFGRIFDLDNISVVEEVLRPNEWVLALQDLGLQGSYHPQNLTGSYNLNLSRSVDYMIAMRLKDQYLKESVMSDDEVFIKSSERRPCWRNVKLNFKPLEGPAEFGISPQHLADFDIPTEGLLSLDFVSFMNSKTLASPISVDGFGYIMNALQMPLVASSLMVRQVTRDIWTQQTSFLDENFKDWREKISDGSDNTLTGRLLRRKKAMEKIEGRHQQPVEGDKPKLTSIEHVGPEVESIKREALEQLVREEFEDKELTQVVTEIEVKLNRGTVFEQNDPADACYYVLEGMAKAYASREVYGVYEDIPVTTYRKGHIMNDEAVCRDRLESMVTVRSASDEVLKMLRIPKEAMLAMLRNSGDTAQLIFRNAETREAFFLDEGNEHAANAQDLLHRQQSCALPEEYDLMAPQPISLSRTSEALITHGFDTQAMEITVQPGAVITQSGDPAVTSYYIISGVVQSNSVWAASAMASVEGAALENVAPGENTRGDEYENIPIDASTCTSGTIDTQKNPTRDANSEGSRNIIPGLCVGLVPLALGLEKYVSTSMAAGTKPVRLLELKKVHVDALMNDHDVGVELSKYPGSYTVKSAQGRAIKLAEEERRLAAARATLDAELVAELKVRREPVS